MIARSMHETDFETVERMAAGLHRERGESLDLERLRQSLELLLGSPELGAVYVLDDGLQLLAYAVGTVGFSIEAGGRVLWVNALHVEPGHRESKLALPLLDRLLAFGRRADCRAIQLERPWHDPETDRQCGEIGFRYCSRGFWSASVAEFGQRLRAA